MPARARSLKATVTASGAKIGRPRTEVPTNAAQRVRELAADGFSLVGIAAKLGTNRYTLSQWFDADPALKEALDVGRAHEEHALHSMLFRLAIEKNDKLAAFAILNSRHGWRQDDRGEQASRLQITFALPGALKPEQFTIENAPSAKTE